MEINWFVSRLKDVRQYHLKGKLSKFITRNLTAIQSLIIPLSRKKGI